jgi:ribosomal protein S18 acetylase RimI-like enzyme
MFLALDKEREDEKIIGLASLVLYQVPTGKRAIIEDVVVDKNARGKGVGEALTRACLMHAEQVGVPLVMLTSNPDRLSANRLYQRMGFELRITNVYRYHFNRR